MEPMDFNVYMNGVCPEKKKNGAYYTNFTISDALDSEKAALMEKAFRFFETSVRYCEGSGSTRRPVQESSLSKYRVLLLSSPSSAPASRKKPLS